MGVVYEARHEVLGSGVALKFLHSDLAKRPGLTQRFLQEARVSATIQSAHVCHVTDVDTAQDGSPYLVMELLAGQALQAMLDRQGRLPFDQAVDFALQILAGLEAAHAAGVVHRDLKPDNVFVTPTGGGPLLKLIDFGIAKLRAASEYTKGLTRAGVVMGTPEYMAPEQLLSAQNYRSSRRHLLARGDVVRDARWLPPRRGRRRGDHRGGGRSRRVRKLADLVPGLPDAFYAARATRHVGRSRAALRERPPPMRLNLAQFAGQLSHAGRLAASAEPWRPCRRPPLRPCCRCPPTSRARKSEDAAARRSTAEREQMGAARTSLSEGDPVMSQMARAPTGTAMGGPSPYGAPPAYGAPPVYGAPVYGPPPAYVGQRPSQPVRPKSRSGLLISALVVAVLGGGGAVGYAAYQAADSQRTVTPPLPDTDPTPSAALSTEVLNPEEPLASSTSTIPTGTGVHAPTTPTTPARPTSGSGGATSVRTAGSGGTGQVVLTGNGGSTTIQLPFPLPPGLQLRPRCPPAFSCHRGSRFLRDFQSSAAAARHHPEPGPDRRAAQPARDPDAHRLAHRNRDATARAAPPDPSPPQKWEYVIATKHDRKPRVRRLAHIVHHSHGSENPSDFTPPLRGFPRVRSQRPCLKATAPTSTRAQLRRMLGSHASVSRRRPTSGPSSQIERARRRDLRRRRRQTLSFGTISAALVLCNLDVIEAEAYTRRVAGQHDEAVDIFWSAAKVPPTIAPSAKRRSFSSAKR